jgi:hypothetical protein
MPRIPAICDACGRALPSRVGLQDSTAHIHGHVEGACDCGGTLRILDGTYSHLGGPLNFCRAPAQEQARFREACRACGVECHTAAG